MKKSNFKYNNDDIIKDSDKIKILGFEGLVLFNEQLDCFDVYISNFGLTRLDTLMGISKRMNIPVMKLN